jgi:hypothetical protein
MTHFEMLLQNDRQEQVYAQLCYDFYDDMYVQIDYQVYQHTQLEIWGQVSNRIRNPAYESLNNPL